MSLAERKTLSTKQVMAVSSLLDGSSILEASELAQVSERTVLRWLKLPEFKAELEQASEARLVSTLTRLVSVCEKAVEALEDVMRKPAERGANVKRLAAVSVLEQALKYRSELTFDERLTRLEKMVGIED